MLLKYLNEENTYEINFKKISKNIVEIIGDFPIQDLGFTLSRVNQNDNWDYSSFTTIYRELDDGAQFSNDGSVYVEPEIIEPKEPTEEENKTVEIQVEITQLKAELAASDYKIIKCAECDLANESVPYDIYKLHDERQALRDKINELESELD